MNVTRSALHAGLLALTMAFGASAAWATEVSVALRGAEETPPVTTTASGSGMINVGDDKSVSGSITTTGIDGTAAHIHLGAMGKAGPPIITLTKGSDGKWEVPAGAKLDDKQLASFKAGDLYIKTCTAPHTRTVRFAVSSGTDQRDNGQRREIGAAGNDRFPKALSRCKQPSRAPLKGADPPDHFTPCISLLISGAIRNSTAPEPTSAQKPYV